jgi:hypothetical protein
MSDDRKSIAIKEAFELAIMVFKDHKKKLDAAKELIDLLLPVQQFYSDEKLNLDIFDYINVINLTRTDFNTDFFNKARENQDKINELLKRIER